MTKTENYVKPSLHIATLNMSRRLMQTSPIESNENSENDSFGLQHDYDMC